MQRIRFHRTLVGVASVLAFPFIAAAQVRVQLTYGQPRYRFAADSSSQTAQTGSLAGAAVEARKSWVGVSVGIRGGQLKGETQSAAAGTTGTSSAVRLGQGGRANVRPVSDTTVLLKGNYFELPLAFRIGPSWAHVSAGPTVKLHSKCDITIYRDFGTSTDQECQSMGPDAIEWVKWNMEYATGAALKLGFVSVGLDAQWSGSQLEFKSAGFRRQQLKPVGRATGLLKIGIGG